MTINTPGHRVRSKFTHLPTNIKCAKHGLYWRTAW